MYHFFTDPSLILGNDLYIEGSDYNHIKNVLRMNKGEVISVSDGVTKNEYRCHIEGFEEERIHLKLDFIKEADVELPVRVTLFQGLPKSDKMEFIVQKAVELGVTQIVPFEAHRSVSKPDGKKKASKVARWNTIAEAAAKQSQRAVIPEVFDIVSFSEAVKMAGDCAVKLIPYELSKDYDKTASILEGIKQGSDIAVFIGPEGGFEESEIEQAGNAGITPISLGRRILRTETAPLVILSWLSYLFEIRN
ncbi:MAG: 16S rRNA (uracil(1498)-N(3))-methyltransferase [Lachnospiraceae bacterium]|nr:16S rRNA (uracil(1498)-N(3))-methyltransferase [Lachnospiraceae bacterium]